MTIINVTSLLPFRQWWITQGGIGSDEKGNADYRYFRMVGEHKDTRETFSANVPIWLLTKELTEHWLRSIVPGTTLEGAVPDFDNVAFGNGQFTLPMHTSSGPKAFVFDVPVPPRPNWKAMHELGKIGFKDYDPKQYHPQVATKLAYFFARNCNGDPKDHWNKCGCPRFHTFEAINVRVDDWFRSLA